MIVVEKRLTEVFSQLPEIDGFKPVYDWGNKLHLIKTLMLYSDAKRSPYPLIYQLSNSSDQDNVRNQVSTRWNAIVSTRNLQTELTNQQRWAMSYENVLHPMVVNMEKAILRAGIFESLPLYRLYNWPNYGSGEENFTADIWDAIEIEFLEPMVINNQCVNTQIRF